MRNLLLFTVFYPGAESFENEFFASIQGQSLNDFDMLVVNDTDYELNFSQKYPDLKIIEIKGCCNISGNRAVGINYAIDNQYEFLMLCDIDDLFSPLRVEKTMSIMRDCDIVVNELDIVDSDNKLIEEAYFSHSVNTETVFDNEFIKDKNLFGFSNTAMRVSKLSRVSFPKDLRIVDWYFYTILLNKGLKARFLPESLTYYRQHSGNMIGLSSYTIEVFKSQLQLKKRHYSYFKDIISGYESLYNQMISLEQLTDEEIEKRINQNQASTPYPLWWENIR